VIIENCKMPPRPFANSHAQKPKVLKEIMYIAVATRKTTVPTRLNLI
jgi:hypothetical protein